MGDENMPNVPSVAPRWPSADVVAQQSVSVIVLKPARNCGVAAMALWDSRTFLVGRAHRSRLARALCALAVRGLQMTAHSASLFHSRRLKLVLNQDQGCLFCIELAPALGFRGLEGAVGLRTGQAHRF